MTRWLFRLSVTLLVLVMHGGALAQAPQPKWHSFSGAIERASNSGRPIVVFVSAPWCGPCRQMEKEVFPSDEVASLLSLFERARLTFDAFDKTVRIGPYELSEAKWAERLGASTTPTLVFMASDGAIIGTHSGFVPADAIAEILKSVVGSTAEPTPSPAARGGS